LKASRKPFAERDWFISSGRSFTEFDFSFFDFLTTLYFFSLGFVDRFTHIYLLFLNSVQKFCA
jgi:hypothetical protein